MRMSKEKEELTHDKGTLVVQVRTVKIHSYTLIALQENHSVPYLHEIYSLNISCMQYLLLLCG